MRWPVLVDHYKIGPHDKVPHVTPLYRAVPAEPVQVEELSMQIRRLVHALKKASPDNPLVKSVADYMRRKGHWKISDVLRSAPEVPEA